MFWHTSGSDARDKGAVKQLTTELSATQLQYLVVPIGGETISFDTDVVKLKAAHEWHCRAAHLLIVNFPSIA